MKYIKIIGIALLTALLFLGIFIAYSTISYYNPPQELLICQTSNPDTIPCNTEMSIESWNIGYAGLGDNMDFFYDSGKKVRDTYERTLINLDSITRFIKNGTASAFYLIQEIDIDSKRSYNINEMDIILALKRYNSAFAPNYLVKFVPIPPSSPLGKVSSGVMNLSRYKPISSTRYGYPGQFGWPNRLFNLRRCMLANRYPTKNGKEFIIINTHMSAFDDGSLKKQEMQYLKDFILIEYIKGNYVVVGGDWNQAPPHYRLNTFGEGYKVEFFKLTNISPDFMPTEWKWVFDPNYPTNRYLNEPYTVGKTFSSIIDFFLVSPNIEVLDSRTINLNFRYSDHNPISMKFNLK
ncbi:MAG: endonuclease/exonuclease/phosphatase family protein [Bacteroidales bacterium]|nr:MAG: endonuclease/exonuclease/phosphatase family protein [Bacteroidales bacterium]